MILDGFIFPIGASEDTSAAWNPTIQSGTVVSVLTGYFDASGAPDQGTVLVVAGFISFESRWLEFERRWNAALRDAGITIFHMGELINRKGEFAGWKQRKRERLLSKLIQIVIDTVVQNFGCIVVLDDWNKVNQDYELAENDFQPYSLAGWSCADRVLDWCKKWVYPTPLLVFEHGDKHQNNLRRKIEDECGLIIQTGLKKPDKKKPNETPITQLQSADLAAWQTLNIMRHIEGGARLTREVEKLMEPWLWEAFNQLFIKVPYDHKHFSLRLGPRTGRASLIRLCEEGKGIPRRVRESG
jgi:hypothetical protein